MIIFSPLIIYTTAGHIVTVMEIYPDWNVTFIIGTTN